MRWHLSHRADPRARVLADRHYNRQSIGAPGFVPPGRCLVLLASDESAFWVTSWPFAEYVKHAWGGGVDLLGLPQRRRPPLQRTDPRGAGRYPLALA
jgi:hypothetical protein